MVTQVSIPGYYLSELLYESSTTVVYRALQKSDEKPVIIKFLKTLYPSLSELVQFRNQYIITKKLDFSGIIQTYSLIPYQNGYALVMEDFQGISLKDYYASVKISLQEFLITAISLCDILDFLYRNQIIHKDIKPANILIYPATKQVKLIDFSIASLLPKETQEIKNINALEGTLAYISPEQTGRMNRVIDYRSDFYSLGITFFELLTGRLPFQSDDLMEMVYYHITKSPPCVNEINLGIPQVLGKIVSKLMSKNAEDRYQSALGLKYDLEICLTQLENKEGIEDFQIGERDISDKFIILEKLYGREKEVEQLFAAFERIAGVSPPSKAEHQVNSEMILIAGFSGIGKTAVVNEVQKQIFKQRGYFIKGKFDQFNRNIPFLVFVQAFQNLIRQLLTESDKQLQQWKDKILEALGENGQIIIEVIPELEIIIGKQAPASELFGIAAENRFNLVFQQFIQVFTTKEHPLVMFLDDLQWADPASLKLIKVLTTQVNDRYLLLIGAYRDNEVSPAHPLLLTLDEIHKANAKVSTIILKPLSQLTLNQMVADTLKCSKNFAFKLSQLVYQKTQGNPFFATQFLKSLHQNNLIKFNYEQGYWECDISQINQQALTEDVVEFMALQLQNLPLATQDALKLAACIGNQFDLETMAIVCGPSENEIANTLWSALQEGLILPQSQVYKFYIGQETQDLEPNLRSLRYKFLHDRVQQAAYSLIPDFQRPQTHWKIGRTLVQKVTKEKLQVQIFDIVNQLNLGIELANKPDEQVELAQLNLIAGQKAKAATAYAAALKYFTVGYLQLSPQSWQTNYDITLALYIGAIEAAYYSTDFEKMEQLIQIVMQNSKTILDSLRVYEIKIQADQAQNKLSDAVSTALSVLSSLNVPLPMSPSKLNVWQKQTKTKLALMGKQVNYLLDLAEMEDSLALASMRILAVVEPLVFFANPQLWQLIVLQLLDLSRRKGNTAISSVAYASYGMFLCRKLSGIDLGYQFGQLALHLLSRFNNNQELKAIVLFKINVFINHWKEHWRDTLTLLLEGYQTALFAGHLEFAANSVRIYCVRSYFVGKYLPELKNEMATYLELMVQLKQVRSLTWHRIYWQAIANLMGETNNPCCLVGEYFNEETTSLEILAGDRMAAFTLCCNKLILNYLFADYQAALAQGKIAENYIVRSTPSIDLILFDFYDCLTRLQLSSSLPQPQRKKQLSKVRKFQEQLKQWSVYGPMNFQHKFLLLAAETARLDGQTAQAMDLYERAIKTAKENEYLQEEALTNELAAKFYLDLDKSKIAQAYMQEAYYCYARWGSLGKTNDLEKRYPQLLVPVKQAQSNSFYLNESNTQTINKSFIVNSTIQTINTSSRSLFETLDFISILKASQALSSQIELDKLIYTLMQVVMENTGATKIALLLLKDGTLMLEALATADEGITLPSVPLETSLVIPTTLINYVKRTLETVVLDDAAAKNDFIADPYLMQQQPKSVLSTPILSQGKLIGLLYLENQLTIRAFTADTKSDKPEAYRFEIIQLLCTQAAISLENAHLYRESQHYAKANAQLYQQAQNYALRLEQTLNELKQAQLQMVQNEKMAILGNLVAGVAHEINNPVGFLTGSINNTKEYIQNIIAHIECYQKHYPNPVSAVVKHATKTDLEFISEDLPKLVGSMETAVERIKDISTSLRTFSRTDTTQKVACNLHEGIDSTLLILKYRLKANNKRPAIEVIKEYGQLPPVKCFLGQLNQVFMNIIANAIDALDTFSEGFSFKEIQANPHKITICTGIITDNNTVVIKIKDNGLGIPQEIKARIFEYLFTTKEVNKGTGLGLAIAKQIVEETHAGKLSCNSVVGEGTEFVIEIPCI
jgi:predicted ATPase/signal transduction histidine kinase